MKAFMGSAEEERESKYHSILVWKQQTHSVSILDFIHSLNTCK